MTNSKSSGDNGFESSDGWEVEDEVEIPNGNGEADNNNMEANFEAICDTARYVLFIWRCRAQPDITSGPEVRRIFKIRTVNFQFDEFHWNSVIW